MSNSSRLAKADADEAVEICPTFSLDTLVLTELESSISTASSPTDMTSPIGFPGFVPVPLLRSNRTSSDSLRASSELLLGNESFTRHPSYYISSGDVTFLVENQLFCVHRYFFVRESVKFRDMLSKPPELGGKAEGTSDASAIFLPEITGQEFASFLWIFYNDKYTYEGASIGQWSSILRLSHMWQFATVKWLAIKELTKLKVPAVDKAAMACAYDVDPSWKWQETAYAELGARDEPIQKEEGMRLGLDIVLKLTELRERIRERRNKASSSYIPSPSPGPYCYTRPMSPILDQNKPPSRQYCEDDIADVRAVFELPEPPVPLFLGDEQSSIFDL